MRPNLQQITVFCDGSFALAVLFDTACHGSSETLSKKRTQNVKVHSVWALRAKTRKSTNNDAERER